MQRVTIMEVARLAGVSPSTVSLYLRKAEAVAGPTGVLVARAVDFLGYVPNSMAGSLAAASSRIVCVVVPSIRSDLIFESMSTLQTTLLAQGLQLLLSYSADLPIQEETIVRTSLSWAPVAIVLTGLEHTRTTRKILLNGNTPIIEMWDLGPSPIDMAVGFVHRDVGACATRHVLKQGRRRVAFLGAQMEANRRAAQRARGFEVAAVEEGLAPPPVFNVPERPSVDAGATLLGRALESEPHLDAVVCSNDLIALGVLFECQRRGLAVPEQLAVVGFGDLPFASGSVPPLTTMRVGDRIGHEVAGLILAGLGGSVVPPSERIVNTGFQLVRRGSA